MIEKITELAKEILKNEKKINVAVDMTAGNGYDSKFILDELKATKLYAFDIQAKAKENTQKLIGNRENFTFILDSHENIDKYVKEKIDLAIYNLGYLPKADKNITTKKTSTINSLKKLLDLLNKDGKIFISVYPGHKEGKLEADALDAYLGNLDQKLFTVLKLSYPNQKNTPPYLNIISKK
ncbi:class I SAM-dependent methyltransferase [Anaerococcus sp. Marseille-P3625]|uniref:tRNA (mnm(5)s(2)U34)-methyltransferase n=1 Tax=Anaerococcus sp. Marseille-P3625 TaxID=1977277 RepID=UPI000C07AA87|nr:class I SAM-dependent methyltransferase [Anaerococcus sp. Marseille-P3625]